MNIDIQNAKSEYEKNNPGKTWDSLRTQSKNRLTKQQRYHREYKELCDAILGQSDQENID